jgi:nucleobase:cation symporter-1, NCS1 family
MINQVCISNWQVGASLVAVGLSVWQTMISVIVGKIIVSLVTVYNGYIGAEWHMGFPILSRFVWGIYGQYLALLQRIVLSLVWFSVQSWTGGLCIQALLASIFPSYQHMPNHFPESADMDTKQFIGWVLFNVLMIPILYIPPEKIKKLLVWMNIISIATLVGMMIWCLSAAHGAGPLLSQPSIVRSGKELGWLIVLGMPQ